MLRSDLEDPTVGWTGKSATVDRSKALASFQPALSLRDFSTMPESRSDADRSPGNSDQEIQAIKRRLRKALPRLRKEFAVDRLYIHGSRLRGDASSESDLDVLVDFEDTEAGRKMSLFDFLSLKQELEDLLGLEVDLGERRALCGPVGKTIEQKAESI